MTVKAAVMGTGFWAAAAHVPALRAVEGVVINACVGVDEAHARRFAQEHGIDGAYASLEALAASSHRPDLLVIAAPDDVHPPATRYALDQRIAVFCEKPLANDVDTAAELAARAVSSGTPATVGFSFRYGPAIQALRRDVVEGALGEPWLIELFEYNSQFHPANGKAMNWKGDPAHARGGALFEYASHILDLAGWLVGPIKRVSTGLTRVLADARLDDIATMQLRFDEPAIGVLVAGWVLSGDMPGIRIRLHGSEGLGEVEMSRANSQPDAYRRIALDGTIREVVPIEPVGDPVSGYAARHMADFVRIVRGDVQGDALPTLGDGARVQAVLEAALMATDAWQSVDELGARRQGTWA